MLTAEDRKVAKAAYELKNKAQIKLHKASYFQKNRTTILLRNAAWRVKNAGLALASVKANKATKKAYVRLKKGLRCSTCSRERPSEQLHFHHTDPRTKRFQLADASCRPYQIIDAEIAKCVVLCGPCHILVHQKLLAERSTNGHQQPTQAGVCMCPE